MSFNNASYLKPTVEYFTEVRRCWPGGQRVVDVVIPIGKWIQEQPAGQWTKSNDSAISFMMDRYIIADELYTMIVLRWG